jgi:hypothetical protein
MKVRSWTKIRALSLVCTTVGCIAVWQPATAAAGFTHATLLSGDAEQQFQEANDPAISQSGEYVAFQGILGGENGLWRRNTRTGELQLVAPSGTAPSISREGRYIAFTTSEDLEPLREGPGHKPEGEPTADAGCPEVYVRDMEVSETAEGAYTLASSLDSSAEGITFQPNGGSCSGSGAQAAPGVALSSDDGVLKVVFTVLSESNLTDSATPPGQVVVRDLNTKITSLVTTTPEGEPVPGGGAFPDSYDNRFEEAGSTAAISADGSTVAWFGVNVAEQVSEAEAAREPALNSLAGKRELEPLWRRMTAPASATRRLLAGAGLAFGAPNPAEPPIPIEAGAFIGMNAPYGVPALSENGESVAVLANAPPDAALPSVFETKGGFPNFDADAYVVHINGDPSSPPLVTPLTEVTSYLAQEQERASITDIAISSDGTRVAFDTERTPLESPSLAVISAPTQEKVTNVYDANLALGTLQRATFSYDGGEVGGDMGLLSFAGDQTLAFASTAGDLFYGDAVGGWQVYDIHEVQTSEQPVVPQVGAASILALPEPEWTLSATLAPQGDDVVVHAQVPGAGRLSVAALAQLPVRAATRGRATKLLRKRGRAGAATARRLSTRAVATAATTTSAAGEVTVNAAVGAAYGELLASGDGLYAVVRVTFSAPGHATLVRELPVMLRDGDLPARIARRPSRRAKGRGGKEKGKREARG